MNLNWYADITSLTQNPAGVLAADTNVVFRCQAVVTDVFWLVGRARFNASTSTAEFRVVNTQLNDGNSTLISTLSTRAKGNENNTQITCVAASSNSSTDARVLHIVIAGK